MSASAGYDFEIHCYAVRRDGLDFISLVRRTTISCKLAVVRCLDRGGRVLTVRRTELTGTKTCAIQWVFVVALRHLHG